MMKLRKALKEESGFTLVEVLVAMMLMLTVMFALYSIFDMSIRVFRFGNDKVEAVENARIGLSKMEREIRAAYPNNKLAGDTALLFSGTDSDTIVFGNDINGNRVVDAGEVITYDFPSGTGKLKRNSQDAVEYVSGLQFDYLDRFGDPVASYTNAEIVKVTLAVNKDGRTQMLSTDVSLRNRNT